jgi:hypothetical protein
MLLVNTGICSSGLSKPTSSSFPFDASKVSSQAQPTFAMLRKSYG